MSNNVEPAVYVGTYRKYNNGSLYGAWMHLSDYSDYDEFGEACRELHKDEEDSRIYVSGLRRIAQGQILREWS